tara:strand:+ start:509 stop:1858 length:1350 start_codon:yes stop_codon:yes gene_type:complete
MITSDYSNQLIKESISTIKLQKSQHRRQLIQKMLCYYEGSNTEIYIEDRFTAKAFQEIPPSSFNITKRFIDRMARIYTLGAVRNNGKVYEQMSYLKDVKMKHIEKVTTLLGTLATQVVVKEHENKKYFDYIPIYAFDVHMGDDPFTPIAIQYPLVQNVDDVSYDSVHKCKYAYWDNTMHKIFDEDGTILEAYEHGFGMLPFVFTHREHQLDSFFTAGAEDIINCNETINILMTEMDIGMRFQAFSQAVITGFYSDEKIKRAGSDEVIVLPEGSQYDLVAPKINMTDAIDLIKTKLDLCAQNNHLYVQFAQDGGETPSGVALKIKDLSRYEDWQDDLDLYKMYEFKFYELEKQLAKLFGMTLPETLKINFTEPEYPMSVDDQIKLEQHQLSNNLTTEWKVLQGHNKDLTDKEAQGIVDENRSTNSANKKEDEGTSGSIFDKVRQTPKIAE